MHWGAQHWFDSLYWDAGSFTVVFLYFSSSAFSTLHDSFPHGWCSGWFLSPQRAEAGEKRQKCLSLQTLLVAYLTFLSEQLGLRLSVEVHHLPNTRVRGVFKGAPVAGVGHLT